MRKRSGGSFFIYENWRARGHVATIHRGECSFCNFGQGMHPGSSTANGRWHKIEGSFAVAMKQAEHTGATVGCCGRCLPN
jgi:hypothetical protein